MKSIFDEPVHCTQCPWKGIIGETGEEEHDDGQLDCPVCHSVAHEYWYRLLWSRIKYGIANYFLRRWEIKLFFWRRNNHAKGNSI